MVWSYLQKLKDKFLKVILAPVIIVVGMIAGFFTWTLTNGSLGDYSSIDNMLKLASEKSTDLKQSYYEGNSFDIGEYDPTISGVLSKFPIATITGLFRPFLWESKNIVMILSGLENAIFLLILLYIFFNKPIGVIKAITSNPLVLFCFIFSIFFAFSVAISTSNFGAMVRLRIPQIPFLLSGLVIVNYGKNNYSFISSHKKGAII
jgi:hypothetical protein